MSGSTSPARLTRRLSSTKIAKQLAGLSLRSDDIMDQGETARHEGRFVFECSWEVANKAPISTEELGDQYCMLGPYNEDRVKLEVEVLEPDNAAMKYALDHARDSGFKMWSVTKVGVPWHDRESNDCIILGFMVAIFLQKVLMKLWKLNISLVFTTHATLIGRHLCAGGVDLYNNIDSIDVDREAGERQIYHRYCIERAAVHLAHVFTTVRSVDLRYRPHHLPITNNLHAIAKEKIHDFIRGHFYGNLNFDLDKTLYIFTAGRYEFTNKGGDFFIEALARLNYKLQVCF
ncbi:unnamed protein product [Strongylus vulgaris]|uniref:Glycogen [starch] synthase n=1 Tax=Strongylus vulgaris TaxID=40348 RepID=A0A3P7J214_STRVU|nr:unnamed protein product [Strongylus vulgaris]